MKEPCHSLCLCKCGDRYETHVFIGTEDQFDPEEHDVDCTHRKAELRAKIEKAKEDLTTS